MTGSGTFPLVRRFRGTFAFATSTLDAVHATPDARVGEAVIARLRPLMHVTESIWLDDRGHVDVVLHGLTSFGPRSRMHAMTQALVKEPLAGIPTGKHLDVGSSWTPLTGVPSLDAPRIVEVVHQADQALRYRDLSLRPARKQGRTRTRQRFMTPMLILLSFLLVFVLPLAVMHETIERGTDVSTVIYAVIVAALVLMAIMQTAEGVAAVRSRQDPPAAAAPPPPATAIIAAYLPNEAATIVETIQSFLAQNYEGGLQVILAYNTPVDLPVEHELRALAVARPELALLKVAHSTSKATNVNAALALVEGDFVGIFDADHHPMPGAFARAWQWLSHGVGIVQGHCVVRNGDESSIARMVAVEFEQIYAVNHPGRARLQGFGIFGGANGYWRTSLLRRVRFQGAYLTEDIDSSLRSVRLGAEIVSDPGLLSRELAPTALGALWRQRMRWAQGWFQVSLRHGHAAVVDRGIGFRQRFGIFLLLGWREAFPWVAALMWPTLAFAVIRDGGLPHLSVVLLVVSLFTVTTGPIQIAFAYRLAAPEIRRHRSWWWAYAAFSVFFYQEWKNLIVRVAHLRQLFRQHEWVVTPRGRVEHASSRSAAPAIVTPRLADRAL